MSQDVRKFLEEKDNYKKLRQAFVAWQGESMGVALDEIHKRGELPQECSCNDEKPVTFAALRRGAAVVQNLDVALGAVGLIAQPPGGGEGGATKCVLTCSLAAFLCAAACDGGYICLAGCGLSYAMCLGGCAVGSFGSVVVIA